MSNTSRPKRAAEYRAWADELRKKSEVIASPWTRTMLLQTADTWALMATCAEERGQSSASVDAEKRQDVMMRDLLGMESKKS